MKFDTGIPYMKNFQNIYHVTHPSSSGDISIFHQKLELFITSRKKDKNCILISDLWFFSLLLRF